MKFNPALKFQLSGIKKSLIIFYIVICTLMLLMIAQHLFWKNSNVEFNGGGLESATIIFLFICGLNSFKGTFHMFLVNGVSRRTMFKSFTTMVVPVAAGMAVIDSLISLLLSSFGNYRSMFYQMYHVRYETAMSAQPIIDGFVWMFAFYMFITMLGFFITTIYYRMNKPIKLLVSIGVPVFMFMVLPYIDATIFNGAIYRAIGYFFAKAGGYLDGYNSYIAVLSSVLAFALFAGLSYFAMRRATVKE